MLVAMFRMISVTVLKKLDIFDSCTFRYGMNHQNLGNGSSFRRFFRKLRPVTGW